MKHLIIILTLACSSCGYPLSGRLTSQDSTFIRNVVAMEKKTMNDAYFRLISKDLIELTINLSDSLTRIYTLERKGTVQDITDIDYYGNVTTYGTESE